MFVNKGFLAWSAQLELARNLSESSCRGGNLSPSPLDLNPVPQDLNDCMQYAPAAVIKLERCRSEQQTLVVADKLLKENKHLIGEAIQSLPPMDGYLGGCRDSQMFYSEARRFFVRGLELNTRGFRETAAVLTLIGYALIGLGRRHGMSQVRVEVCHICCFRNCEQGSRFCNAHRYGRQRDGQHSPSLFRRNEAKLKKIFFEHEITLRENHRFYLLGLNVHERGVDGLIRFYAVSEFSVAWIKEILSNCPCVKSVLGAQVIDHIEAENWAGLFDFLKQKIDPNDDRTSLDFWCAKLLQAEAWFVAEKKILGEWVEKPIHGGDGKVLRSGQHSSGTRGPRKETAQKMDQITDLVMQGGDLNQYLASNGLSHKVLRQWKVRYPTFASTLDFYIKRQAPLSGKVG